MPLDPHKIYMDNNAYLFILKLSSHWFAKRWRCYWRNLKHRNLSAITNLSKLKSMQNEIIIKINISKAWCQNFARPAGMHYNHCVSPSNLLSKRFFRRKIETLIRLNDLNIRCTHTPYCTFWHRLPINPRSTWAVHITISWLEQCFRCTRCTMILRRLLPTLRRFFPFWHQLQHITMGQTDYRNHVRMRLTHFSLSYFMGHGQMVQTKIRRRVRCIRR